jgi:hypothetical protein
MFCIFICIYNDAWICIWVCHQHMRENMDLCLPKPGLLHLT